MTQLTSAQLRAEQERRRTIGIHLARIAALLPAGARITLIARHSGSGTRMLVFGDDTPADLIDAMAGRLPAPDAASGDTP